MSVQTHESLFGALANAIRLNILTALRKREMNVTQLVDHLGIKQSTVSHNLKKLMEQRLVVARSDGPYRYFSLDPANMVPVLELMERHAKAHGQKMKVALERTQDLLHTIVQNAPILIYTLDKKGKVTNVMGHDLKVLGFAPEQLIGRSAFDIYPDRPDMKENVERALKGQEFMSVVNMGGHIFETRHRPLVDGAGKISGVVAVSVDVTDERLAQDRLQVVLDHVPVILFSFDREGLFTMIRGKGLEKFGVPQNGLVGQSVFILCEAFPSIRENVARALAGEDVVVREKVMTNTIETRYTPIKDAIGSVLGAVGLGLDITVEETAKAELQLMKDITLAMAGARDLDGAMGALLRLFCPAIGAVMGQAWSIGDERLGLVRNSLWYGEEGKFRDFREASKRLDPSGSTTFIELARATKETIWIADVSADPTFLRRDAAESAGLRAGLAVPIVVEGTVIAVFEFFFIEANPRDERVSRMAAQILQPLGSIIRNRRAEKRLARAGQQLREHIDKAPSHVTGVDPEGKIMYVSGTIRYPEEQVMGRSIVELSQPAFREPLQRALSNVAVTGESEIFRVTGPDAKDELRLFEVLVSPLKRNGKIEIITVISRDVTASEGALLGGGVVNRRK